MAGALLAGRLQLHQRRDLVEIDVSMAANGGSVFGDLALFDELVERGWMQTASSGGLLDTHQVLGLHQGTLPQVASI